MEVSKVQQSILDCIPYYTGIPIDINMPDVCGQLIISKGVDFYIVVNTREIEEYFELNKIDHDYDETEKQLHYKIGGFVKVHPDSVKRLR